MIQRSYDVDDGERGYLPVLMFGLCAGAAAAEYLQTVQATSVLACIFAILALFVFVAQLFTLPKGQRFTFTGILQLIACK